METWQILDLAVGPRTILRLLYVPYLVPLFNA
jgi:hypothetical protein